MFEVLAKPLAYMLTTALTMCWALFWAMHWHSLMQSSQTRGGNGGTETSSD